MRRQSQVLQKRPLVQLHRADCMDVLRELGDESVQAVVTDPPYGISYQNKKAEHTKAKIANDDRPFIWWLWDATRVLADGGALVCFCRWDVQEAFRQSIELAGLKVRSQWVWDRKVHGMGDCKATLAPQHEVMWLATKGRFAFPNGRPKSLVTAQSVPGKRRLHPTQKPSDLMRTVVRAVTPKTGIVLDPCMGSGSTGECVADGYGFVGCELEKGYYDAAVKRIRALVKDKGK